MSKRAKAGAAKPVRAWVSVPRRYPHMLNGGYWIGRTRQEIRRAINDKAALPYEWEAVMVEMRRVIPKPTPSRSRTAKGKRK